ncbi:lasso peptide biosynthesis B2 protein [Novosphingobium malaysiense]|uniref:Microcin J25-processing protein McjB C-terminal domain-containing protein n=1 Tax=Novosphingobium malaysiense TaxID=1348853 RepID=A0A0B1ZF00_9SPHN|nr:lasso peptide biosynthesis B2 protein [Novosphingobium malaysiense]KHK89070.1 hypothetical protein LK12_22265 [Novosphingobium malaysiense]
MDLGRDRYFCLDAEREAAFASLLDDPGTAPDRAIDDLRARGLLVERRGEGSTSLAACPSGIASRSLLDAAAARSGLRHLPGLARALSRARRDLRKDGLAHVLSDLAGLRARPGARASDLDMAAIARAFETLALLATHHDQCLPRSLAMCRYLIRRGIAAEVVFAVKLDPFKAHCWVEADGWIVNDRLEAAMPFTPIRRL